MASPVQRVQVALDTALVNAEVVAPGNSFSGILNVESAPAGLDLFFRFGRNGDPILVPVGGGIVSECDTFTDGLFLDTPTGVPGAFAVIQIAKTGVTNAG